MKTFIFRILKLCGCYSWPDKFFTIKIGQRGLGKGNNVCLGCIFKCDVCGRKDTRLLMRHQSE